MNQETSSANRVAEIERKVKDLESTFAVKKEEIISKSAGAEARDKLLDDAREAIRLREQFRDKDKDNFNLQHERYAFLISDIAKLENDIVAAEAPDVVKEYSRERARLSLEMTLLTIDTVDARKLLTDDSKGASDKVMASV